MIGLGSDNKIILFLIVDVTITTWGGGLAKKENDAGKNIWGRNFFSRQIFSKYFFLCYHIIFFPFHSHSRSRLFQRIIASDSCSRNVGMDFFIPFPFPNFGIAFYSFPSRSQNLGIDFFIPFPFPNLGSGLFPFPSRSRITEMFFFHSCSRSRSPKTHSCPPLDTHRESELTRSGKWSDSGLIKMQPFPKVESSRKVMKIKVFKIGLVSSRE